MDINDHRERRAIFSSTFAYRGDYDPAKGLGQAEIVTSEALFQYVQALPRNLLINVQDWEHRLCLIF